MTFYDALPSETTFDPKDKSTYKVSDWINVLHNSLDVKPGDERYERAQGAKAAALQHIGDLHALENHGDVLAATPGEFMTFAEHAANEMGLGIPALIDKGVRTHMQL